MTTKNRLTAINQEIEAKKNRMDAYCKFVNREILYLEEEKRKLEELEEVEARS